MDDTFKIYVHRLREGTREKIAEGLDPSFLDIHEADLAFEAPVVIDGTAEVADGTLVLSLSVQTEAQMDCAICSKRCRIDIAIPHFYFTIPLDEIKGAVFDFREMLREAILLELPYRVECDGGCPERANVAQYLKNSP